MQRLRRKGEAAPLFTPEGFHPPARGQRSATPGTKPCPLTPVLSPLGGGEKNRHRLLRLQFLVYLGEEFLQGLLDVGLRLGVAVEGAELSHDGRPARNALRADRPQCVNRQDPAVPFPTIPRGRLALHLFFDAY